MAEISKIILEHHQRLKIKAGDIYEISFPNYRKTFIINDMELTCLDETVFYAPGQAVICEIHRNYDHILVFVNSENEPYYWSVEIYLTE